MSEILHEYCKVKVLPKLDMGKADFKGTKKLSKELSDGS